MRIKILLILLVVLVAGSAFIFLKQPLRFTSQPPKIPGGEKENVSFTKLETPDEKSNTTKSFLDKMSLEEKIGQLIIGGLRSTKVDQEAETLIEQYNLGGVNLIERNLKSSSQTRGLNKDIQLTAQKNGRPPLFIAVDQEGGPISRLRFLKELTPQERITNVDQALLVAQKRAEELTGLGFNMIFSPVLDYVTEPKAYLYKRVFHMKQSEIISFGTAMIKGYESKNIISVPKHFPGYSNIRPDPHKNKDLEITEADYQNGLQIFSEIIKQQPAILMTAHVVVPVLDEKPVTLSQKIFTQVLRGDLGYKGIVVSDDLSMASVLQDKSVEGVAVEALVAGNDMLISTLYPENLPKIIQAVSRSVKEGKISEEKINKSVEKIIDLKLKNLNR